MKTLQDCATAFSGPVSAEKVSLIAESFCDQAFMAAEDGQSSTEVYLDGPTKLTDAVIAEVKKAGFTVEQDFPVILISGWVTSTDPTPAAQDSSASSPSTDAQPAAAQSDQSNAPDAGSQATSVSADSPTPAATTSASTDSTDSAAPTPTDTTSDR